MDQKFYSDYAISRNFTADSLTGLPEWQSKNVVDLNSSFSFWFQDGFLNEKPTSNVHEHLTVAFSLKHPHHLIKSQSTLKKNWLLL